MEMFNYRVQRYRGEWEDIPEFENRLRRVPGDDNRARCVYCHTDFNAQLASIREHLQTARHRRNDPNRADPREDEINRKVKIAKIKLSAVFADTI